MGRSDVTGPRLLPLRLFPGATFVCALAIGLPALAGRFTRAAARGGGSVELRLGGEAVGPAWRGCADAVMAL